MREGLKKAAKTFLVITWLLLFAYFAVDIVHTVWTFDLFGPRDVSRRVTASDESKTALLERDYGYLDLNFRLYMMEGLSFADLPEDFGEALWVSRDYELTTDHNWHEDIEWSTDSSVIAVTIEGQYIFAYDFKTDQRLKNPEAIQSLLKSRNSRQG